MPERTDFWEGLVTGTLVGMVIAAYARGDFKRFFTSDFADKSAVPSESLASGATTPEIAPEIPEVPRPSQSAA